MSSTSTLFGTSPSTLIPGPRLVISRAADGMTTGSMDFSCRKGDAASAIIQAKLAKGQPITGLYPAVPTGFNFLLVDDWTSRDEPGGYSVISVSFKGVTVEDEEWTFEGSVVYSRNNALRDDNILNNPNFLTDVPDTSQQDLFRGGMDGRYVRQGSDTIEKATDGADVGSLNTDEERYWWTWIVTKGNHTFLRATSEWTKTATGKGSLRASDFASFGKIDTPPGSPAAPDGEVWLYSGATESIAVTGDGANSYSKTWISGDWPEEVYGASAPP